MKRLVLAGLALAGCHDDHPGNASLLWLAPDQNETHVKLVEQQPDPY